LDPRETKKFGGIGPLRQLPIASAELDLKELLSSLGDNALFSACWDKQHRLLRRDPFKAKSVGRSRIDGRETLRVKLQADAGKLALIRPMRDVGFPSQDEG
jgi:hypothetical protein